jgi:hypothetical protein
MLGVGRARRETGTRREPSVSFFKRELGGGDCSHQPKPEPIAWNATGPSFSIKHPIASNNRLSRQAHPTFDLIHYIKS